MHLKFKRQITKQMENIFIKGLAFGSKFAKDFIQLC